MNIAFTWPKKEWLAAVSIAILGFGTFSIAPKTTCVRKYVAHESAHALSACDYWLRGWEKFNRKDYKQAVDNFRSAHSVCALRDLNSAIDFDPNYSDAFEFRGYIKYFRCNDSASAIRDINHAVLLDDVRSYG